jgi:hypothetical protein
MSRRTILVLLIAVSAVAVFTAGFWAGFAVAKPSGQAFCSVNPCRITMTRNGQPGLVIKDARGPKLEHSLLIIDPNGLPEFWQTASGAFEGPKGVICTTDRHYAAVACLDSDGKTGAVRIGDQMLTAADIRWLHQVEQAVTPSRP